MERKEINLLAKKFHKNGLLYRLIVRNDLVALYGVGGTFTDNILHYEVCRIYIRDDQYGYREAIPSNEQFGRDDSRAILDYQEALAYYEELTSFIRIDVEAQNNDKSGKKASDVDTSLDHTNRYATINNVTQSLGTGKGNQNHLLKKIAHKHINRKDIAQVVSEHHSGAIGRRNAVCMNYYIEDSKHYEYGG